MPFLHWGGLGSSIQCDKQVRAAHDESGVPILLCTGVVGRRYTPQLPKPPLERGILAAGCSATGPLFEQQTLIVCYFSSCLNGGDIFSFYMLSVNRNWAS